MLLQIHEPGETPLPHVDDVAIGIDLGTTHSVVAIAHEGTPDVLTLPASDERLLPSIVQFNTKGEISVGGVASDAAITLSSIKRLMGRGWADARALSASHSFPLAYEKEAASPNIVALKTPTGIITPVEVSAEILAELKAQAEEALGKDVKKAVITVPAYFDDAARTATRDAARLAGLEVLRLVNEPTAAALAYGLDSGAEGLYAVYDLGGGTFDFSLLKLQMGVFQVLSTAGDIALGGDDFDAALLELAIGKEALEAKGSAELQKLMREARSAKEALSDADSVELQGKRITRAEFENAIALLIKRSINLCENALEDAGVASAEVKGVVLVGGSTRVPAVQAAVKSYFGTEPLTNMNPDEVVALGAALQAEALTHGSSTLLLDVTPLSLGLETMGGIVEKVIHRNSPIPTTVEQEFTTYQDGQTGMIIHILQGEREMVEQCRSLAKFELTGIPPLAAGVARIAVRFMLDADGLLSVSATEQTTGVTQQITVKPSYGLSEEEVAEMLFSSQKHAMEDMSARLLAEARVNAERSIIEIESAIKQSPELLKQGEEGLIQGQIKRLRSAIAGTDREAIDYEVEELSRQCQGFAQRRMDNAILLALKGSDIEDYLTKNEEKHA